MWIYRQSTGIFMQNKPGGIWYKGYAGHPPYVNDPYSQDLIAQGPLPRGFYLIGSAFEHPSLGPVAMRLDPDTCNRMYGRSEFLIHGDNPEHPGKSSDGCIVLPHDARVAIDASEDRQLEVTW